VRVWLRLGLVILVALIVRLSTSATQSGWLDEGYSIAVAKHDVPSLISFIARNDVHPFLYYLVLHIWLAVFGGGVEQARLLSLCAGLGSVLALYAAVVELFDRFTALCASLLYALSPLATWYASEARMYALGEFFTIVALGALLHTVKGNDVRWWEAYVSVAVLAFYTDYSMAYTLVALVVFSLVDHRCDGASARLRLGSLVVLGVLTAPIAFLARAQSAANAGATAWIPTPTLAIVAATIHDFVSLNAPTSAPIAFVGLGLAALGVRAWYDDRGRLSLRGSYVLLIGCVKFGSRGGSARATCVT